jgi:hypothetical protein
MIKGMVAGLEDRLKTQGGTPCRMGTTDDRTRRSQGHCAGKGNVGAGAGGTRQRSRRTGTGPRRRRHRRRDPMIFEDLADFAAALPPFRALAGLDLGEKTVGVAVSDRQLSVASPLSTIRRTKFTADATALLKIATDRELGGLILGLPLNMDGSEGPRCQSTRAFACNLTPPDRSAHRLLGRASVDRCRRKSPSGGGYVAKTSLRGHRSRRCRVYSARST